MYNYGLHLYLAMFAPKSQFDSFNVFQISIFADMKRLIIAVNDDLNTDQRVLRIAGTLSQNGFDVFLFGRMSNNSKPLKIGHKAFRAKLLVNKGMMFYFLFNWRLFWFLMTHKFDAVLSNDLDSLVGSSLASILKHKPVIYDSHEYYTEVPELVGRPFKRRIWLFAERLFLPRTKASYTVCQSIADIYYEKYHKHFDVVRNVPYSLPKPNVDNRRNVVMYQGALNLGRGIELMIDAMKYLSDCELVIAGSGDIDSDLRKRASSLVEGGKITFLGRLAPDELHSKTLEAKVGLSLEEDLGLNYHYALPNKLFDYIQARVPVIVADLPEMRNIVQTYKVGQVLTDRTPQSLANLIHNVMAESSVYYNNLDTASMQLCWENESKNLLDIYQCLK